ncbi:hypothetical protein ABT369_47960 [Dactylosporangium sp. NPDC000244]|uniref:hypothetical protein n=1 Tax=Dactylosporangium sp. NPDC000244 TaxID=3154365 RepID=UPI0033167CE2
MRGIVAPGAYWVGVIAVVLFGALTAGVMAVLVVHGSQAWRYGRAPLCSATVASGCRDRETVTVLDAGPVDTREGRSRDLFRLNTANGVEVLVPDPPREWRSVPPGGIVVTLERFDDAIVAVSAGGQTRSTIDSPGDQLPFFVPAVPVAAGLTWYAAAFAGAARGGRRVTRRPRARRVALAIVIGGFVAFFADLFTGVSLSMPVVLAVQGAGTVLALAVLMRRRTASAPPRPTRRAGSC